MTNSLFADEIRAFLGENTTPSQHHSDHHKERSKQDSTATSDSESEKKPVVHACTTIHPSSEVDEEPCFSVSTGLDSKQPHVQPSNPLVHLDAAMLLTKHDQERIKGSLEHVKKENDLLRLQNEELRQFVELLENQLRERNLTLAKIQDALSCLH
ncbi:hypothetical protein FQN57_000499 [Myotisia sp. PD_48]|nr:hypothetical protein FQN57_000499 [Myotisia sp. PD_48]